MTPFPERATFLVMINAAAPDFRGNIDGFKTIPRMVLGRLLLTPEIGFLAVSSSAFAAFRPAQLAAIESVFPFSFVSGRGAPSLNRRLKRGTQGSVHGAGCCMETAS